MANGDVPMLTLRSSLLDFDEGQLINVSCYRSTIAVVKDLKGRSNATFRALHDVAPLLKALDIMDTYWSVGTRNNQVISVVQCLQHSANDLGLELAHLHDNIGYGCTERGLERCVA
jgi:hypothetical protein